MTKTVKRLILGVAGLLIGLLMAEGGARMKSMPSDSDLLFNSPESSPEGLYVLDKETRVKPASNFKAKAGALDYQIELRTNSIGLRGPKLKDVQGRQWAALGDSFTMAVQVEEKSTFFGILGKEKGIHFWNAGVDGYSTWQAGLRFRQLSKDLKLDGALLTFFTGNDFQDNERFPHMRKAPLPGISGAPIPRESVSWWKKFLLKNSHLYAHIRIQSHRKRITQGEGHFHQNWKDELRLFTKNGRGRLQGLENMTVKALRSLRSNTRSGKLMVAIAPPAFVVDQQRASATFELVGLNPAEADLDAPQRMIRKILKQERIPYCPLTEALREGQKKSPMYYRFDGHWTPEGHKTVARRLSECFKEIQ